MKTRANFFFQQGDELMFEGTLELPVPIGTRGGAVQSHPTVKYTHQLMQNPDCSVRTFTRAETKNIHLFFEKKKKEMQF